MSPKERIFVLEYLIHFNASEAVRAAGYKCKFPGQMAGKLLEKPDIKKYVARAAAKREKELDLSAERTLQELARIAFVDVRKAVTWESNKDGDVDVQFKDSADIDAETAAAIAEVTQLKDGGMKIKFHSKPQALNALARHHGLIIDRKQVTHIHEFRDMSDDELDQLEAELAEQARIANQESAVIEGTAVEVTGECAGELRANAETAVVS